MPQTFTLRAQFNSHRGPTSQGDHKIMFDIQPEEKNIYPFLEEMSKYPFVILKVYPVEEGSSRSLEEDEWDTNNRRIHAMFGELAEKTKTPMEDVKKVIKDKLVKEGKIKMSLKELKILNQEEVIERLKKAIE